MAEATKITDPAVAHNNDRLTELLFRLPAELRNDIYQQCLPTDLQYIEINKPWPHFHWLACSPQIFAEAATLLYRAVPVYTHTRFSRRKSSLALTGDMDRHLRTTFGKQAARHLEPLACGMVRELVVDLRAGDSENGQDLPSRVRKHFDGLSEKFTGLKKLHVYLGPSFMAMDPESLHDQAELHGNGSARWTPVTARLAHEWHLGDAMQAAKESAPPDCIVQWRVSALWTSFQITGTPRQQLRWASREQPR